MCHPIPPSPPSSTPTNYGSTSKSGSGADSGTGVESGSGFQFLWASERSGYRQLYLYQYTPSGSSSNSNTIGGDTNSSGGGNNSSNSSNNSSSSGGYHRGDSSSKGIGTAECLLGGRPVGGGGTWIIESIEAIDVERGLVYFSGNQGNHTEKHLFVASYIDRGSGGSGGGNNVEGNEEGSRGGSRGGNGGGSTEAMEITDEEDVVGGAESGSLQRLTSEPGWHVTTVNTNARVFVDVFSAVNRPPITRLYALHPLHQINPRNHHTTASSAASSSTASSSAAATSSPSSSCRHDHPVSLAELHDSGDDPRLSAMLPVLSMPRLDKIPLPSDTTGMGGRGLEGEGVGEGGGGEGEGRGERVGEGVGRGGGGVGVDYLSNQKEAGGLHCAIYLPNPAIHGPGPYPTIVSVYGGPGPQRVSHIPSHHTPPTVSYP